MTASAMDGHTESVQIKVSPPVKISKNASKANGTAICSENGRAEIEVIAPIASRVSDGVITFSKLARMSVPARNDDINRLATSIERLEAGNRSMNAPYINPSRRSTPSSFRP